jgi:hypothetical protein
MQVFFLAYGAIDELEILYGRMVAKIVDVLAFFYIIIYGIYYNYKCSQYVGLNVGVEVQSVKMCH